MPSVQLSKTLVKSQPELWAELSGGRFAEAVGGRAHVSEPGVELVCDGSGVRARARLEPAAWGTSLTMTVSRREPPLIASLAGALVRALGRPPLAGAPPEAGIEERLTRLIDELGSARRKPFGRD